MKQNDSIFSCREMRIGVETVEGNRVLVEYFLPEGSGYATIPEIDIRNIGKDGLVQSRKIRAVLDRQSQKSGRGGIW